MLNYTAIFLILFASLAVSTKLHDELNLDTNTKDNNLREERKSAIKFKDIPLRSSFHHKHKHKFGTRHHGLTKRLADDAETRKAEDAQCAVLYKNHAPVGILQPFEDSYKFLPIRGEPTLVDIHPIFFNGKQGEDMFNDRDMNNELLDEKRLNRATFVDENYPSVFTKFQLHNRKDLIKHRTMSKREDNPELIDNNLPANNMDTSEVEGKLKSVLTDMGLLNDYVNEDVKRDTEEQIEDENLEIGTNKIELVKEGKVEKRTRRDEEMDPDISAALNGTDLNVLSTTGNSTTNDANGLDLNKATKIIKKSSEDNDGTLVKRSDGNGVGSDCKSEGSHQVVQYEKRVEREIRDKIKRIKDEVIKEINTLADKEDDLKRQKRQTTTTLLDEENKDIDPNFNTEENKIHIRRKRSTQEQVKTFDKNSPGEPNKTNDEVKKIDTKGNSRRSKRQVDAMELDNDEEEEELIGNEEEEEVSDDDKLRGAENCYCNKDDTECECVKNMESPNVDEEEAYEDDLPSKYVSKKSIQQWCSCDKDGAHCKCRNNNQNFDYYEDVNDIDSKSIDKKAVKQCSCDKNGANCKCDNRQYMDNIASIDGDYSDYMEEDEIPFEDNDISSFNQDYYEDDYHESDYEKRSIKPRKYADAKSFRNGEYFVDLQPNIYRLEPIDESRNKREIFNELIEANGGDSARNQLVAVRQRSMLPLSRYRRRIFKEENDAEQRKLTNMSEEDLFGALPQSFGGELVRYKRVKRSRKKK